MAPPPAPGQEGGEESQLLPGEAGSSSGAYPIPIAGLTLVSPSPHHYEAFTGAQAIHYTPMPYATTQSAPHHSMSLPNPHGFHPYHPPTFRSSHRLAHSPEYAFRPPSPLNPGFSPGTHHRSTSAISPNLVSPASVLSSVGSVGDVSPAHYGYSIPSGPSMYAGTPLSSMTNLSSASPANPPPAGLAMVSGFPYHTTARSPRKVVPPVPRPKPRTRASTTSKVSISVKKERKASERDEEDESMSADEEVEATKKRGALGLSPATNDSDDRVPLSKDDLKQARIQSEQRRRDELREGFDKLREALPQTNLRASKVSVLDRAVSYIQQTESANHYLLEQNEALQRELDRLRHVNEDLVHAVAAKTRSGSGSSPGSSSRAVAQ